LEQTIPSGIKCLKPKVACQKLAREKSWLWDRVRNDPAFPKPIYLGGSPVFLEAEIDKYILSHRAAA
jgi:predicted DNA-binding transcriptional regulator AlpA